MIKTKSNALTNGRECFNKAIAVIGFFTIFLLAGIMFRNLNMPHPKPVMNFDEAVYGGLALELAESGNYTSRRIFPAGLRDGGGSTVVHTLLSPYLQAKAIQFFGFDRFSLRLHSLILYAASSILLVWLVAKMALPPLQAVAALALFFLSPWLVYAGTTGRSESVGMFLVFAATFAAWVLRNQSSLAIFISGVLAGAAVYNHATFLAAACLPYLFFLRICDGRESILKTAPIYAIGSIIGISALWLWLMLPEYKAWQEEFVAAGVGAWGGPSLLGVPLAMKHLFSTFGTTYLNWYLAGFAFLLIFLKPTRYSLIGLLCMLFFMIYLLMKMGMVINYCVQFAVGIPILALLSGPPRFHWANSKCVAAVVGIFFALQAPWNAWRVTADNAWTEAAHSLEKVLYPKLARLPSDQAIIGDFASCIAILKAGHRFFYLGDNWAFSPEKRKRFERLCNEQATHVIDSDGMLIEVPRK
jgi:4-amino-4-deoxy-L-arabinose transferase-like glycosyltransferase